MPSSSTSSLLRSPTRTNPDSSSSDFCGQRKPDSASPDFGAALRFTGKDSAVLLATTKTRKQNKHAALQHKSVMKKEFRQMAKSVNNQVGDNYYRPDLKKAALARLSVVNRSLQVAKSGVKKKTKQATRIPGRK